MDPHREPGGTRPPARVVAPERRRPERVISLVAFDPGADGEALVAFLTQNTFPFHAQAALTPSEARARVMRGHFWSAGRAGFWVVLDGERIGIAVLSDLEDIPDGGAPLFDLRLAQSFRGAGLGEPVLRHLTTHVFESYPGLQRFEGQTRDDNVAMRTVFVRAGWVKEAHYRRAWPVEGGEPRASTAYGILRQDWESGTVTPVIWDDLPG